MLKGPAMKIEWFKDSEPLPLNIESFKDVKTIMPELYESIITKVAGLLGYKYICCGSSL